jgi:hypothetical protein
MEEMLSISESHKSSWFERFMASAYGRLIRIGIGIALIAAGLTVVPGVAGWIIAALGLVPVSAGVFGLCPIAPIWGGHFIGAKYCAAPVMVREREE